MTHRPRPRCTAVLDTSWRPRLAAVEAARIAGDDIPATDWQCVRPDRAGKHPDSHAGHGDPINPHLAMPLGHTGRSVRFTNSETEPTSQPEPADEPEPTPEPTPADPTEHLTGLVDQLARRGVGVVRAEPGDTLVLVVPEGHEPHPDSWPPGNPDNVADAILRQVQPYLPGVAVIVLAGVTGAIVVPSADTTVDAAEYTGPTEFEHTAEHGLLPVRPGTLAFPAGWCKPLGDETTALLTCRARAGAAPGELCGLTFTTVEERDRHEGPDGPHPQAG